MGCSDRWCQPWSSLATSGLALCLGAVETRAEVIEAAPETIIVTGERERLAAGVGKSEAPIRLTPATINIVDRELIDVRQPRNFVEALRTVPGVNQTSPRISTQNLLSRGFSLRQAGGEFRNGLRHFETSNLAPELTNTERFELLKGPASVLYGIGGLGGVLNVVTKTPITGDNFVEAEVTAGSYGFYRGASDVNVTLGDGWSARVSAHIERAGSFQDDVDQDSVLVAPVIAWRPDDRTTLVLDFEYLRADLSGNRTGTPADGSALPSPSGRYPKRLTVADPNFNSIERTQIYAGYTFDRQLSEALSFRQGFLYNSSPENDLAETNPQGFVGGLTGPRRVLTRRLSLFVSEWSSFALDTNLAARFATGRLRHDLLVGVDLYYDKVDNFGQGAPLPPIDIFAPVYGVDITGPLVVNFDASTRRRWAGLYLQDTISLGETLRLLLSGRVNYTGVKNTNRLTPALSREANDSPFLPRIGLVWTPAEPISLFASWSRSFQPLVGANAAGESFVPEEGESYEIGAKGQLGGVAATLALFDMVRTGVTTTDPLNPQFSIQTGEQTSRGVELELDGELVPGWRVTAAYTYLDTEVSRDNRLLVGQPLRGVPDHSASLWTTYRLSQGPLAGLGLSGGIFHESSRWGELVAATAVASAFRIPGYTRVDLGASWRRGPYEAIVAVENITNTRYFSGVLSRLSTYYGSPTSVTATLRARF